MHQIRLVVFLLLLSLASKAQFSIVERVNIDLSITDNDEFNVVPLHEKGLIVLNTKSNNFGRDLELHFIKFDTTLLNNWDATFQPGFLYKLLKYYETENYLYCLFREDEKDNLKILRLDVNSGDMVMTETKLLTNMEIDMFSVIKSKAVIGGRYNDRPVIELVSLFGQSSKVLPEIHSNNIKINNIEVNEREGLIYVMMKNVRNCKISLKVYDYEGKIVGKENMGDKNKIPLNGRLIQIPNGDYLMAGSYADNCSEYSVGFYTYNLSHPEPMNFYDFVDLDNFLSYMSEKRQERLKNRISKKTEKGKEFKLRQRLMIQDPIEMPDGMILMAEVFYPEYKNYSQGFYAVGRNYRWGGNNYYAFNNFRYTHSLILKFDKSGKIIMDNSISMNELESRTLDNKAQVNMSGGNYIIAYADEGTIKTTILDQNFENKKEVPFMLDQKDETVLSTLQSELSSWYPHHFIAYGVRNIRSTTSIYPKEVFYLNKLRFE